MQDEFIAHRRESDGEVQPLNSHLWSVGTGAANNASKLKLSGADGTAATLGGAGELIGLLHDLGKYSKEFQNYLKSATGLIDEDAADFVDSDKFHGRIDHSTAGSQSLWKELAHVGAAGPLIAQMLSLCVASHHSGLIDCISADGTDVFGRRMAKLEDRAHHAEAISNADVLVLQRVRELISTGGVSEILERFMRQIAAFESAVKGSRSVLQFKLGLLTRILFSCLLDADRVDTADFERPHGGVMRRQGHQPVWGPLIDRLELHLSDLKPTKPIDPIRSEISDHCRVAAGRKTGMFTLTVPTGGGKTLASLRFALHHAKLHDLEHIIYVVPFTSIIDQNADTVRKILEPDGSGIPRGSIVLEHHSNLTPDEQTWRSKILSENWDAPVVFTTSVQLLETLFGAGTRGARRMHQLANAVIIFDEAQTLPVRCVHMFNNAVNFLVEHCGSSVVLCTATQPLLNSVAEQKGAARFTASDEIVPNVAALFKALQRTKIVPQTRPGGWTDMDVAKLAAAEIEQTSSCLVVTNTRKAARSLYESCDLGGDVKKYHLSTSMCPAHRRAILAEIRDRLTSRKPTFCASTSLIECGVDVDFGAVIRYEAGLDSVAQAAGRCNRNGVSEDGNGLRVSGNVHVINPVEDNVDRLTDIKEGRDVTRRILSDYQGDPHAFDDDLLSPKAMNQYFDYYFYRRSNTMSYSVSPDVALRDDTLLNMLSENTMSVDQYKQDKLTDPTLHLRQAFMTAAKAFRAINAPTKGVIVPYGSEGSELIANLCGAFDPALDFALLREAQQFSVNVFPYVFDSLLQSGAISEIQAATGIYHLHPSYYSDKYGLSESPVTPMETNLA